MANSSFTTVHARSRVKSKTPSASTTRRYFAKLKVVELPLSEVRAAARNARTHPEEQIERLMSNITMFGFLIPILIDDTRTIVAGHARLEAARRLELKKIPTIIVSHLNKGELRAFAIAENKVAMQAGWDTAVLALEFEEIRAYDPEFDLEYTGFATPEIDLIIGDNASSNTDPADEGPELLLSEKAVTSLGDLWLLGDHRLLCGNSQSHRAMARLMNGSKAAICLSDPPFNCATSGHISVVNRANHPDFQMAAGEMDEPGFIDFLRKFLALTKLHCDDGALIYSFMDWRNAREILEAARACSLTHLNTCVWVKSRSGMGSFYRSQHEFVFVFRAGEKTHRNNIQLGRFGRNRSNVWNYRGFNTFSRERDEALSWHPTVKPLDLIMDAIKDCTRRRDLVLDPFCGSGTTLIAAERTGRITRCMELEPRYVDVAIRRWQTLTGHDVVLESSNETFAAVAARRSRNGEAK